jgi:hypothetical protein
MNPSWKHRQVVDIANQDIYSIYEDAEGKQYDLSGNPLGPSTPQPLPQPQPLSPLVSDLSTLKRFRVVDIEHQDIYDVLGDGAGNFYDLSGQPMALLQLLSTGTTHPQYSICEINACAASASASGDPQASSSTTRSPCTLPPAPDASHSA